MKVIYKLMVFTGALLLLNATVWLTLTSNQRNGVYPVNADSIGIPLAETASLSMVGAAVLGLLVLLNFLASSPRKAAGSRLGRYVAIALLLLVQLLATVFFALWGLSWFGPHHYPIVVACSIVVAAIVYFAVADFRSLRPNNSFKPKPLCGSA